MADAEATIPGADWEEHDSPVRGYIVTTDSPEENPFICLAKMLQSHPEWSEEDIQDALRKAWGDAHGW